MNSAALAKICHEASPNLGQWLEAELRLIVLFYHEETAEADNFRTREEDSYCFRHRDLIASLCRDAVKEMGYAAGEQCRVLADCPWRDILMFDAAKTVILRLLEVEAPTQPLSLPAPATEEKGNE